MTSDDLPPEPHHVLGVAADATPEQVRAAYRRAVRATHPDLGGDASTFRAVQAAYRQLTDAKHDHTAESHDKAQTDGAALPPPPPGLWRTTAQWPPVRIAAGGVYLALALAARGPIGALVGILTALALLAPAVTVWTMCTVIAALRDPARLQRPTLRQLVRWLHPGRILTAAAGVVLLYVSAATSIATAIGLGSIIVHAIRWMLR